MLPQTVRVPPGRFDLAKAQRRQHLVEGLLRALAQLDAVVAAIRAAPDGPAATAALRSNFGLSDEQVRCAARASHSQACLCSAQCTWLYLSMRPSAGLKLNGRHCARRGTHERVALICSRVFEPTFEGGHGTVYAQQRFWNAARKQSIWPAAAIATEHCLDHNRCLAGIIHTCPATDYRAACA